MPNKVCQINFENLHTYAILQLNLLSPPAQLFYPMQLVNKKESNNGIVLAEGSAIEEELQKEKASYLIKEKQAQIVKGSGGEITIARPVATRLVDITPVRTRETIDFPHSHGESPVLPRKIL